MVKLYEQQQKYSHILGIRTKFDCNRPINLSNIIIFEQDQLKN